MKLNVFSELISLMLYTYIKLATGNLLTGQMWMLKHYIMKSWIANMIVKLLIH